MGESQNSYNVFSVLLVTQWFLCVGSTFWVLQIRNLSPKVKCSSHGSLGSNRVSGGSWMERGEREGGGGGEQRHKRGEEKEGAKAMNTLLAGG